MAIVQAVMGNHRRRTSQNQGEEGLEDEVPQIGQGAGRQPGSADASTVAPSTDDTVMSGDSEFANRVHGGRQPPHTLGEPLDENPQNSAEPSEEHNGEVSLSLAESPSGKHHRKHRRHVPIFDKSTFEERLILEEEMMNQIPRCFLFLAQFCCFMAMLWKAYPSDTLLPIYQALTAGLEVDGVTPTSVSTVEGLKEYLPGLANQWKGFSPGSSTYVQDPLARKYLGVVTATPPVQNLGSEAMHPIIGPSFTFAAWVRTSVRFDTIIKKVQPGRNNAICWKFDLERILYGQHEMLVATPIVNPMASGIWAEGVDSQEVWKSSDFRKNVSDNAWHHFSLLVQTNQVTWLLDGDIKGVTPLPRPITDCANGLLTIGSDTKTGELVDVQYIPRIVTLVELSFIRSMGRLPDDVLSGAGVSHSSENQLAEIKRLASDSITNTDAEARSVKEEMVTTMRQLFKALSGSFDSVKAVVAGGVEQTKTSEKQLGQLIEYAVGLGADETGQKVKTVEEKVMEVKADVVQMSGEVTFIKNTLAGSSGGSSGGSSPPAPAVRRLEATSRTTVALAAKNATAQDAAGAAKASAPETAPPTMLTPSRQLSGNDSNSTNSTNSTNSSNSTMNTVVASTCTDNAVCHGLLYGAAMALMPTIINDAGGPMTALLQCLAADIGKRVGEPSIDLIAENAAWEPEEEGVRHYLLPSTGECDSVTPQCIDTDPYGQGEFRSDGESWGLTCAGIAATGTCKGGKYMGPGVYKTEVMEKWGVKWDPTTLQACCACGGGQPNTAGTAVNVGVSKKKNKDQLDRFGDTSFQTVDQVCTWVSSNQLCTAEGDKGAGFLEPDFFKPPLDPTKTKAALELWKPFYVEGPQDLQSTQGRVYSAAVDACVACGDGEIYKPSYVTTVMDVLQNVVKGVEISSCNNEVTAAEFRSLCPETCVLCPDDRVPTRAQISTTLLACNDEPYSDWLGQDCSFYALNDASTIEAGACTRYAADDTRQKCLKTCETCDHCTACMTLFDLNHNNWVSQAEFNYLLSSLAMGVSTKHTWRDFIKEEVCINEGRTDEACWLREQYPEVSVQYYKGSVGNAAQTLTQKAAEFLARLQESVSFLPEKESRALKFAQPSVYANDENLAVQGEIFMTVYDTCATNADCENKRATACGNLEAPLNVICDRKHIVPMYCATKCRTGGCGEDGSVFPKTEGSYCQPCDGCVLEAAGFSCPAWCEGYYVKDDGQFDKIATSGVLDEMSRGTRPKAVRDEPGSFTLSAWVRHFDTQWMFQKRIKMPGLEGFEGYDAATGELICWQVNPFELRFRNRWDEKAMTSIKNPLSSRLTSAGDSWHYIVFRKDSFIDTFNNRREDFSFMVDGVMSELPVDGLSGERVYDIPPYGFPDCGGNVLSISDATQTSYEGPKDFYNSTLFPEFLQAVLQTDAMEATLPLAPMSNGKTVVTFEGVRIPYKAKIQAAHIEICAAQRMAEYLWKSNCANMPTTITYTGNVSLKVVGLKAPTKIAQPGNEVEAQGKFICEAMASSKTTAESIWEVSKLKWLDSGIPVTTPPLPLTELGDEPCTMVTPDVTDIVAEMLTYLDEQSRLSTGPFSDDMTFVFADAATDMTTCAESTIFAEPGSNATYAKSLLMMQGRKDCDMLRVMNEFMIPRIPLWMIPVTGPSRPGASAPKLVIRYCLNEDCVSPAFLGAGESARDTATAPMGKPGTRRLEEDTPKEESQAPTAAPRTAAPMAAAPKTPAPWSRLADPRRAEREASSSSPAEKRAEQVREFVPDELKFLWREKRDFGLDWQARIDEALGRQPAPAPQAVSRQLSAMPPAQQQQQQQQKQPNKKMSESQATYQVRRLKGNASCTSKSCLRTGDVLDQGLATSGSMLEPKFSLRAQATSELQQAYYSGLPIVKPSGQGELSGGKRLREVSESSAEILQYPREVVSVIPPVIFQRRSQFTNCSQFTPGLAPSLEKYFVNQNTKRCSSSYTCSQMSGFACVDRSVYLAESEKHFDRNTLQIDEVGWYPEFLDMFSVPTIFRDRMVSTADWIDLQTSDVQLVNVFLAPNQRVGTVMTIQWTIKAGKVGGMVDTKSFVAMSPEERDSWYGINICVATLAGLDLLLLAVSVFMRWRNRRAVFKELTAVTALSEEQEDLVGDQLPLLAPADIFDIFLRCINIAFTVWHLSVYPFPTYFKPSGTEDEVRLEFLEQPLKMILDLEWNDPNRSVESKVTEFMQLVVKLNSELEVEQNHRLWARILVLLFFVRIVIYMRVHPRIAILYSTLIEMYMDFMHFLLLATTLYCVLAFLGTWSFGDKVADFGDFQTSLYTQFRMIVGEFNLPTDEDSGFKFTFGLYAIIYFLMVFSLLLNFFLAIVIDSYANVKDSVKDCKVENSVAWDIPAAFAYPMIAMIRGWPQRPKFVKQLMRTDMNQDGQNDEDEVNGVAITAESLVRFGFMKNINSALAFMRYYEYTCPAIGLNWQEKAMQLDHKKAVQKANILDKVYFEVKGESKTAKQLEEAGEIGELKKTLKQQLDDFHSQWKTSHQQVADSYLEEIRTALHNQPQPVEDAGPVHVHAGPRTPPQMDPALLMSIKALMDEQASRQDQHTQALMRSVQEVSQRQQERDEVLDQIRRLLENQPGQTTPARSPTGSSQDPATSSKSQPRFVAPRLRH